MVFTGTYEHSIDAKNRLAVPAEVRSQISRAADGSRKSTTYLYVTLSGENALCLYTEEDFERRAKDLDHSELEPEELLDYERLMFSLARRVELDKQGRVRLPENLLEQSRLGTDVVLIGVKDHLEIRDRQAWLAHVRQKLAERPSLMNPRQAMRKPKQVNQPPA